MRSDPVPVLERIHAELRRLRVDLGAPLDEAIEARAPGDEAPYDTRTFDLSTARDVGDEGGLWRVEGRTVFVHTLDGNATLRIGRPSAPAIALEAGQSYQLTAPFTRLYVTNAAQASKTLILVAGYGDYRPGAGSATITGTVDVDLVNQTLGNVDVDIAEQSKGNLDVDLAAQSLSVLEVRGNPPSSARGGTNGSVGTSSTALSSQACRWALLQNTEAAAGDELYFKLGGSASASDVHLAPGESVELPVDNLSRINLVGSGATTTYAVAWVN